MRRVLIYAYAAFLVIMLMNFFYYKNMYQKQIKYVTELLDRQVQIVGIEVDSINNNFVSDLTQISYNQDMSRFFDKSKPEIKTRITEQIQLFMDKYKDFVSKVRIYDNNLYEYTLSKDEVKNDWIENEFTTLDQHKVLDREQLILSDGVYSYYTTILSEGKIIGNIVVGVDYNKYFQKLFSEFSLREYQWQWVLGENGGIIYDNSGKKIQYSQLDKINANLADGNISDLSHLATIEGKNHLILSSYYSTQLLQRDLGLIFSAPSDIFQKYIILNSTFIVLATLLIVQIIIFLFWRYIKEQNKQKEQLRDSEGMLLRLIEEMPVGIIIHNRNREIIKANKVAAEFYSYDNENNMKGKLFPETYLPDDNEYFSKHLGGKFRPDQFVVIKKEIGEIILFRSSIPAKFMGEDATLEILIDITMLESARKQEVKANVAKSEFLARMSYEIRTPLNGIIGMTDILSKNDLNADTREIVALLRRSTEVLLGIINDILDFSKIESGKIIIDETQFNIREEISYTINLAKTHAGGKEIDINYRIDNNVPENLIGDAFRLRQIIVNLINHSISNTEKGEIRLYSTLKESNNGVLILQFEIADTGRSFDKPSLKKIFGDFVGSENVNLRSNEESVFGTIIARQLVELMGGELTATSPSGLPGNTGKKVVFTIHTYSSEKQLKDLDLSGIRETSKIRALLISGSNSRDDEFLAVIHKLGIKASVTSYHKATVNQVKAGLSGSAEKYNLIIIMDEEGFDGFEAARALRDSRLTPHFIVLMVSSNDQKGNYLKSVTMGIDHYLVKPVDASELYETLRSSFTYLENVNSSIDLDNIRKDLNLLVVEDNRMNQLILIKMLQTMGYECDLAEDGYEGLTKANDKKYDLIFMDLLMPEMDGFESARRIIEKDKSALIVAFTADNMPETKRKAELSGIKDFISKPVRVDDLKKLLARNFYK